MTDNYHFESRQVEGKMKSDVTSVAEAVLEEARSGKYRTLVLGRRGGIPTLPAACRRISSIRARALRCASWNNASDPGTMPGIAYPDLQRDDYDEKE